MPFAVGLSKEKKAHLPGNSCLIFHVHFDVHDAGVLKVSALIDGALGSALPDFEDHHGLVGPRSGCHEASVGLRDSRIHCRTWSGRALPRPSGSSSCRFRKSDISIRGNWWAAACRRFCVGGRGIGRGMSDCCGNAAKVDTAIAAAKRDSRAAGRRGLGNTWTSGDNRRTDFLRRKFPLNLKDRYQDEDFAAQPDRKASNL